MPEECFFPVLTELDKKKAVLNNTPSIPKCKIIFDAIKMILHFKTEGLSFRLVILFSEILYVFCG